MNYNFSDISKIPEYLSEMQKRQNDFDKKLKTIEKEFDRKLREKNQEISELKRQINSNEILANCRRNNEIFDNLSTRLNDAERAIKQAISKAAKIEKLADDADETLGCLKKKLKKCKKY
jgi:sugar-specific transcriptional regulator TrmB